MKNNYYKEKISDMMLPKILQQTLRNNNRIRKETLSVKMMIFNWTLMGLLLSLQFNTFDAAKQNKGDVCQSRGQPGICKEWSECPIIKTLIEQGEYTTVEVVNCGFSSKEEIICCPVIKPEIKTTERPNDEKERFVNSNENSTDRPAVKACRRLESGLKYGLADHILGGTPVRVGEFPFMAGIGYSRIGGDGGPPYDIRCGGSLIDKRFVLTAAHCVAFTHNVPSIVRLGVVNNTAGEHMKSAVELKIKKTILPEDYSISESYNDIAILELEREVDTNNRIYPVCLHTDINDPDTNTKLWVSGFGWTNVSTRSISNILLKTSLHTVPIENCNQSYIKPNSMKIRDLSQGVRQTQICATYRDEIKDSCEGDSGGPLHLVVDASRKNFRLVGVVSTGFTCGSRTPGLYTRVAAFLDFIEKTVWPNDGDE